METSTDTKLTSEHLETAERDHPDVGIQNEKPLDDDEDRAPEARGREAATIDKSYRLSARFLGSMAAIGLGFCGGTGGYALIAPVLGEINNDLGPSPNVTWVGIVYVLSEAVFFALVGKLSDIFGRRWFFIIGSLIGVVGSIVGATAQNINTLIGSEVLIGISAAFQISFFWVISEIVPMRWRYLANSYAYMITIPTNPLAAKIAFTFQKTLIKWRGSFWFITGVNALSAICWYLFYHPPTFKMLHRKKLAKDLLLHFDWVGLLLYTGGLLIFLLGLNWGGALYVLVGTIKRVAANSTRYPWTDGHVIGCLVAGGVILFICFPAWELLLPFKNVEPFLPLYLFTNVSYQACCWLTGIGAGCYYGFSLVWPQAVASLYTLSYDRQGTLAGLAAMGFVFGQMFGGIMGTVIGPRTSIISTMWIAAPVLMAAAADPLNMKLTMGLIITGAFFIGASEAQAAVSSTFSLRTQEELGTAGGLAGAIRSFVSVVAVAIYSTVLTNRRGQTIPRYVTPAVEEAGLPASSVPALLSGLAGQGALSASSVPGLTAAINATAVEAYRHANAEAYKTIFFTSFAFGGAGMILVWFVSSNDKSKENYVAGHVHDPRQAKALEAAES
ncbi:hypothetical protein LTR78_003073 [Recurvomyces mirabilis]|uniref:Major facilitator superfamily (MFS) profile domain-containing protein n=1 Tax=Recurvomyces mirabilis TaxID=574656 RepID=A0AAE0WRV6_9PEZI|nr:hypothetical protein LTR78_003073 [Recurvomyces mirabilis]KAK5157105.1 hypothetical protein LTS14_004623 [Recurvomyces mirabilis]